MKSTPIPLSVIETNIKTGLDSLVYLRDRRAKASLTWLGDRVATGEYEAGPCKVAIKPGKNTAPDCYCIENFCDEGIYPDAKSARLCAAAWVIDVRSTYDDKRLEAAMDDAADVLDTLMLVPAEANPSESPDEKQTCFLSCPNCKTRGFPFEEKKVSAPQLFRDEELQVEFMADVCRNCGCRLLNDDQATALLCIVSDTYREKHGLLTSEGIIARRKALNVDQEQFAGLLGVDPKQVRLWETYRVQQPSMDQLIRTVGLKDF